MSESYARSVEERLTYVARVRSEVSKDVVSPYDFRSLQKGLLNYISSLKSLIITVPRDILGENFLPLYRRIGGLEPLVLRAADTNQLLRYLEAADDAFVELVNALFRAGVISSGRTPQIKG
ncbi:hypothetical protein DDW02_00845 [Acidilobus sp. SCGC AC-742_M05]|nr:hypothetical protein DDW02_00845 [Acidilobus sp. SCGC AC-742_M05]